MADVKKIATRESYGNALKELGALHSEVIVFDADLSNATKTNIFKKAFPDRHFNCGIAEGNMMAVAAGTAAMGLVPFVSSFAMFAAGRAFEQVRNSIGYPHLNVKIGATHGGISVGEAVCAVLSEKLPTPVRRIGVNDEFGHSGPAVPLLKQFGLSAEHITEVAKDFCTCSFQRL